MKVRKIGKIIMLLTLVLLVTMTLAPSVNAAAGKKWSTQGNSVSSSDVFGTTNNQDLRIVTNGQQRMVITADGKVGIGTAAPTTELDVNGVITATGGNSGQWNTAYGWGDHAAAGYMSSYTETDPVFGVSPAAGITGTQIGNWDTAYGWGDHAAVGYDDTDDSWIGTGNVYTTSGNVGIGTTNPITRLHVEHNIGGQWAAKIVNPSTTGLGMTVDTGSSDPNYLAFRIRTGGANRFWVVNDGTAYFSGNVGIGTTSPSTKLEVNGVITATGGNSGQWNTAYGWGDHAAVGYDDTDDSWTGTGNVYTTSGNVGIGTTNPITRLHVEHNIGGQWAAKIVNPSTTGLGMTVDTGSSDPNYLAFRIRTGGANRFWVVNDGTAYFSGNVGIGTTNPTEKLHIAGNLKVDGSITIPITTRHLSIPPSEFAPGSSSYSYCIDNYGSYHNIRGTTSAQTVSFYASVQLPDGADITKFTAYIKDSDSTEDITVSLLRYNPSTGGMGGMTGALSSSGTPGRSTLSTTSVSFTPVNSTTNVYLVHALWKVPTNPTDIHLEGIFIEYTITTPLP